VLFALVRHKKPNQIIYSAADDLPAISILLAAYNEESVIAEKIESTFRTTYPLDKIEFIIGSDASTDSTNTIVRRYCEKYPQLQLVEFPGRSGKVSIINQLARQATGEILVLTDANVFFKEETLYQLVKHYKNPAIGLTGGNILNEVDKTDGIARQEKTYITRENRIKYEEGLVWGTMIGVFGGCYSIRRNLFSPVPDGFTVDDFFITMQVLQKGSQTILEPQAVAYEDVSNHIREEFRRKVRISIGNFQNLDYFANLLWPPFTGLAFAFFSHKILRWLGPFFIALAFVSALILAGQTLFYKIMFVGQLAVLLMPAIDWLLKKIQINIPLLRFVSHFYVMNLALLTGFFNYVKGVKTNVWKPTQRYQ
jgi:cellulose synthase/poly-beta-1,6-N-acetylglucosamine synthase-like glycosyltransferase